MLTNFLLVGLGAAFGVLARALTTKWISRKWPGIFPASTFIINITGSFLLGFITAISFEDKVSLLLGTGVMGAFTTFSTFNIENIELLHRKHYRYFFVYIGASYFIGIGAVFAGIATGNAF